MVDIELCTNYRILSDGRQYILAKNYKWDEENERWNYQPIGYYRSMDNLIRSYLNIKRLKSHVETFEEFFELIKEQNQFLDDLKSRFDIVANSKNIHKE